MAEEPMSRFDNFTNKVVGDPAKPQDTLLITGFLGASSDGEHTRVYSDPTLDNYFDIANHDIVHTEPLSKEQSPLGGHYVWVKKNAEVLSGKAGTERTKAKFLEGPIAAQAGGAGFAGGTYAPTIPFIACHPTVVVQLCPTILPAHCPSHFPVFCPSPIPIACGHTHFPVPCPPSPLPILCHTPICPTLPQVCFPPITVNQQQCVASGGGFGCPVGGGPGGPVEMRAAMANVGMAQPGMAQAGIAQAGAQLAHTILCPSVLIQCHSVPIIHCFHPSAPPLCLHTALVVCNTVLQPQCFPVASPNCPPGTGDCPIGGLPGGGVVNPQMQAFAAAAYLPPTRLPAQCITLAPSVCGVCPSVLEVQCPTIGCTMPPQCPHTPLCPTHLCPTPYCPTSHPQLCPTKVPAHCPTFACTETLHCLPTPNPQHCPTPNMMCPHPSVGFQCPSHVEICPSQSPIFCRVASPNCPPAGPGGPVEFQGAAMQAPGMEAAQRLQLQPSIAFACHPSAICPGSPYPVHCTALCPPHTVPFYRCYVHTPQCPIATTACPPPQSLACGPGGFGGFNPGF
jgi:hypothetical protein